MEAARGAPRGLTVGYFPYANLQGTLIVRLRAENEAGLRGVYDVKQLSRPREIKQLLH